MTVRASVRASVAVPPRRFSMARASFRIVIMSSLRCSPRVFWSVVAFIDLPHCGRSGGLFFIALPRFVHGDAYPEGGTQDLRRETAARRRRRPRFRCGGTSPGRSHETKSHRSRDVILIESEHFQRTL